MTEASPQSDLFSEIAEPVEPELYFSTPGRAGLLQQLTYVLQFGEGLAVVQGPAGVGKSFLARELRLQLGSLEYIAQIQVAARQDLDELLLSLVDALGIVSNAEASRGELLSLLRHFTQELVASRSLALVILDDAQYLDGAAIGALMSLLQGDVEAGSGLRMVFFSRPGLIEEIDELQLLDVAVFDFDMPFFSLAELSGFLSWKGVDVRNLSPEAIKSLWNQSRGNPGFALSLALEPPPKKEFKLTFPSLPVGHFVALGVLLLVLMWALFSGDSAESPRPAIKQPAMLEPSTAAPTTPPLPATPIEINEVDRTAIVQQPTDGAPNSGGIVLNPTSLPSGLEVEPEVDTGGLAPAVIQIATPEPSLTPTLAAPSPTLAPVSFPAPVSKPSPQSKPSTRDVQASPPELSAKLKANESLLLAQPVDYYTLQVLAASKADSLASYMERQSNRAELYIYRSLHQGASRYVVVVGLYRSKQEALAAIKRLPAQQQKAGPWVKSLKAVHQEIEEIRRN